MFMAAQASQFSATYRNAGVGLGLCSILLCLLCESASSVAAVHPLEQQLGWPSYFGRPLQPGTGVHLGRDGVQAALYITSRRESSGAASRNIGNEWEVVVQDWEHLVEEWRLLQKQWMKMVKERREKFETEERKT